MLAHKAVSEVADGSVGCQEDNTGKMEVEESRVLDARSRACDAIGPPMQNVEAVAGCVPPAEVGRFGGEPDWFAERGKSFEILLGYGRYPVVEGIAEMGRHFPTAAVKGVNEQDATELAHCGLNSFFDINALCSRV